MTPSKPTMIARKPIWECMPIDLGHAYAVSVTYRGRGVCFNTYHLVDNAPGMTHEQAARCWFVTMQNAINKGWKP